MPQPFRSRGHMISPEASNHKPSDSSDEYLSEDEDLSDNDLNLLNSDYGLQKDFTFYTPNPYSFDPGRQSPPSNLHRSSRSADLLPSPSEEPGQDLQVLNGAQNSPRDAFLKHPQAMSRYDYNLPPHRIPHRKAHAYQYGQPRRRPLIDFIKNEWQHTTSTTISSPTSFDHLETPNCLQVFSAPRVQRSAFAFLLLLFLLWGNWKTWAGPQFDETYGLRQSSKERLRNAEGWFGQNLRPEFTDMVHIRTMEDHLVPGTNGIASGDRRLIVIGDVHGCNDEVVTLLQEAQYDARTDHLIFAGDMISKGPASAAVVDLAISTNASCVRGNHEDRVLLTYRDISAFPISSWKKGSPPAPGIPGEPIPTEDKGEERLPNTGARENDYEELSRLEIADRKLAHQLNNKQIEYLNKCPVILDVGQIPGLGDLHIVHAGLIPGVILERQDPVSVMHMRTVDLETHVPSSRSRGTPWYKLWNHYQSLLPVHKRSTIIYGHDSKRGLQLHPYTKGIDTNCFSGGKLSALIIDGNHQQEPKLASVECKNYKKLAKSS